MDKTTLGDRMKSYENVENNRATLPLLPIMIRLDGRGFSKFTRGLKRPYDENMSKLMVETTKFLCEEINAKIAYTQSDEISAVLYNENSDADTLFSGRYQKLVSICASLVTAKFNQLLPKYLPEKVDKLPVFDCRVWQVPTKEEAANSFLFRELDAAKNSVSMAAQHYYSHKELMNKTGSEMQEMLFSKGINWNDYPAFFKRGTFVQKRNMLITLDESELAKIPEKFRPKGEIIRSKIVSIEMPPFNKVTNRVNVIFNSEDPKQETNVQLQR